MSVFSEKTTTCPQIALESTTRIETFTLGQQIINITGVNRVSPQLGQYEMLDGVSIDFAYDCIC